MRDAQWKAEFKYLPKRNVEMAFNNRRYKYRDYMCIAYLYVYVLWDESICHDIKTFLKLFLRTKFLIEVKSLEKQRPIQTSTFDLLGEAICLLHLICRKLTRIGRKSKRGSLSSYGQHDVRARQY